MNFAPQPPPSSKWRPKNVAKPAYNYSSPRPAAMAHNQFINHPTRSPPKMAPPPQRYHAQQNQYVAAPQPPQSFNTNTSNNNKSDFFDSRVVEVKKVVNNSSNQCTALKNAKMRIVKKMSEISLDSEGGSMVSPHSDPVSPNTEMQQWNQKSTNGREIVADEEVPLVSFLFDIYNRFAGFYLWKNVVKH